MIKHNMLHNQQWLCRGILAIFARQTDDEQNVEHTRYHNSRGFNGTDAKILSSFAKQIERWNAETVHRYPTPLSDRQLAIAARKMGKYAVQLVRVVREKAA
jgi:hypothetical protein